mgnify:CR=1 FL=1
MLDVVMVSAQVVDFQTVHRRDYMLSLDSQLTMDKPPIIIGGCPRSGTTLLRTMLGSHPNICAGPELAMTMQASEAAINTWNRIGERAKTAYGLEDGDFARAYGKSVEHILEIIRQKKGKPRIADKMPQSVQHFPTLCWMLPDSPLIHIIRDGRDVACSIYNYEVEMKDDNGNIMEFAKDPVVGCNYWKWITGRGMILRDHPCSDRYYEIFYENLVRDPEKEMRKLLKFINEPWSDQVLDYFKTEQNVPEYTHKNVLNPPSTKSIGKWKKQLSKKQKKRIREKCDDALTHLGYSETALKK